VAWERPEAAGELRSELAGDGGRASEREARNGLGKVGARGNERGEPKLRPPLKRAARGGRSAARGAGRTPAATRRAAARTPRRAARVGPACRWVRKMEKKGKMENVFSLPLKIAILTHLDSDFEKVPIGENVLLFELYNFVNWLDFKFCTEI